VTTIAAVANALRAGLGSGEVANLVEVLASASMNLEAAAEEHPDEGYAKKAALLDALATELERRPLCAPVPREDRLYLGDNGRYFCGRLEHAGMTAYYTGRDLSGQAVLPVTDKEQREAGRLGLELGCESCRSQRPTAR
jgi:hypothetical protein